MPDPLLREDRQSVPLGSRSGEALRVGIAFGIFRMEAEEPHDPQVILADAGMRIADEADAAGGEIAHAVGIVVKLPVETEREGVDGEIAPPGIEHEIAPEMHDGMAPIGFHILAQGRDLERLAVDDHGDRAVIDPGRNRLEPGLLRPLHDRIGQHGGGAVDFRDGPPEQAHCARRRPRCASPRPGR